MNKLDSKLADYIKSAQWFELVGELFCMVGSVIYMHYSIKYEEEWYYSANMWGSFCYFSGAFSMMIQSIKTLRMTMRKNQETFEIEFY